MKDITIEASGTFSIGGELEIYRLGFGAMRITGTGIWGPPSDVAAARAVLRRVVELGINFIDTADSYGPNVSEELIADTLYPYPEGLVIATKGGFERPGPNRWMMNGHPDYLRRACEGSLKRLRVDRIDLYQLHRIDPKIPAADQFGVLADLQDEGKIRFIGLSEVTVADLKQARETLQIVTVQNRYNISERSAEDVLEYCQSHQIGFIPWYPLLVGKLAREGSYLDRTARSLKATPSQVALAWLLARSPVMLPIPGTSSVEHLEENTSAAMLTLQSEVYTELSNMSE